MAPPFESPSSSSVRLLEAAGTGARILEAFRPLPLNLEWRLSELHWLQQGVTSFVTSEVPYRVNNDGRASAAAAAVMFAHCQELAESGQDVAGPIRLLEIGAGSALFARYLLDEFRDLCQRHARDFYDRLVFHVTDRSPRTVDHWTACGVFGDHGGHVVATVCDAGSPSGLLDGLPIDGPLHAVFTNYVLDSLPAAVLRRRRGVWEQLATQASLRRDVELPVSLAGWDLDRLRDDARSDHVDDLVALLPLLPLLDGEARFQPIDGDGPPDWERRAIDLADGDAMDAPPVIDSFGAIACLDALVSRLDPAGFVLVRDYGPRVEDGRAQAGGAQRFGDASAMALNFAQLEQHLQRRGLDIVRASDDPHLQTRLVTSGPLAETRRTFQSHFAQPTKESVDREARIRDLADAGLWPEALTAWREAIASSPRDWQLVGAAAEFASQTLGDANTGLGLARAALQLNPWYRPGLWNTLGRCLSALGRDQEAHDAFGEALRLHPRSAETHLELARSWLRLGKPARCLEAVAHGLAADVEAQHRHALLDAQEAAIGTLARRAATEREVTHRRRLRLERLVALDEPGSEGK